MIFHPCFPLYKEDVKYVLDTGDSKVLAVISLWRVQFSFSNQNEKIFWSTWNYNIEIFPKFFSINLL